MAEYITKIRTSDGDLPIDYNSLANLPKTDSTLSKPGGFADAQAVGNKINEVKTQISDINEQLEGMAGSSHTHSATDITSGTLSAERLPITPITKGGTGSANGADGLKNLFAAGPTVLTKNKQYGDVFPSSPVEGQIFFLKV